ncbi:MAG: hypothetical protein Kow0065_00760 [Methylomicrobium sp.]
MAESVPSSARTLLLVDDEINIVNALKRSLRRDGYQILTANSGVEALAVLAEHRVGVIVSDQRMPQMSGADFLSEAKALYPDTVRIMLSGYTDLESVTSAINEGAIYKFLTKPWDDEVLRDTIRKAFEQYETVRESLALAEKVSHPSIGSKHHVADEHQKHSSADDIAIDNVSRIILDRLPIGVVAIDRQERVIVANDIALRLLVCEDRIVHGEIASRVLPEALLQAIVTTDTPSASQVPSEQILTVGHMNLRLWCRVVEIGQNTDCIVAVICPTE